MPLPVIDPEVVHIQPLVPIASGCVIDPSQVDTGEGDYVEFVSPELIGESPSIPKILVLQRRGHRMVGNLDWGIAVHDDDDSLTPGVLGDVGEGVSEPGDGRGRHTAMLRRGAGASSERERKSTGIHPNAR